MSSSLDQYMFISSTTAGKSSNVQSYVQSRIRKVQWENKYDAGITAPRPSARTRRENEASVGTRTTWKSSTPRKASNPTKSKYSGGVESELTKLKTMIMQRDPPIPPMTASLSAPDPFASTAVQLPAFAWKFLKWPLSTFTTAVFRAESLDFRPKCRFEKDFRHVQAVAERLRLAVRDELQMASTLLYAASVLATWENGEVGQRSLELFNLWTIKALRRRLAQIDRSSDPDDLGWVILAIHSLSLAAIWNKDLENAICHMSVNRQLIQRVGIKALSPYVREAILIGDKYLAIIRGQPAFAIPLNWDEQCPINLPVNSCGLYEDELFGRGLGEYLRQADLQELNRILQDIIECMRVAAHTHSLESISSELGSWVFMRHLSLTNQLIAYNADCAMENCCRIGMLLFLLLVGLELGARARGRFQQTLDRLDDLISASTLGTTQDDAPELLLWMAITFTAAAYRWEWDSRDRYLGITRAIASRNNLQLEISDVEEVMQKHLYIGQMQRPALVQVLSSLT